MYESLGKIFFTFRPCYFGFWLLAFSLLQGFWHMVDIWLLKLRFLSILTHSKVTGDFVTIFVLSIFKV